MSLEDDDAAPSSPTPLKGHDVFSTGMHIPDDETLDPTMDTYGDLTRAFEYFNQNLFDGRATPCLITLRASGRSLGYFSPNRFVRPDGRQTHEIALNPEQFGASTIENSLSTLVHEMVHLLQFEQGTAGRKAYHNRAFADEMLRIGLPTSSTGRPGGAVVGEHMSHYIAEDGPFLSFCRQLVDAGFRARWADRFATRPIYEYFPDEPPSSGPAAAPSADSAPTIRAPSSGKYAGGQPSLITTAPDLFKKPLPTKAKATNRVKFVCPSCKDAAWGKPSLSIVCGRCTRPFLSVASSSATE